MTTEPPREEKLIPAAEARIEMRVVNSRFIATAGPTFTVEEAKVFIDRIRGEFSDASHNVPAYLIGHPPSVIAHCNDDGEPSGTAGRPALAVLRGSGLGDVTVVVTRYFGGTKLGTGGLVRAYGDAVREVLEIVPRAVKVATHTVSITMPYSAFEPVRRLVRRYGGVVIDEAFAGEVTLTARLRVDRFDAFRSALEERSNGTLQPDLIETNEPTILPIG